MFLNQGFFGSRSGAGGKATPGRDGITPTIGANGNWFIGTKDTGISAGGLMGKGVITLSDDPKTKPYGRYYVNGKFTGAPTLPSGSYTGLMDIIKSYDGQNGDVIRYYTRDGLYYLMKFSGGWANAWVSPSEDLEGRAITNVALSGNTLTFTHGDGAKHSVTLPQSGSPGMPAGLQAEIQKAEADLTKQGADINQIKQQLGEINHNIQNLSGIYSFRGVAAPTDYPTEPKNAYFINLHNSAGLVNLPMPQTPHPLNDGTVYFVNNENTGQRVTVTPPKGDAVDNATSLTIEPLQFVMLVRHGNNWIKTATGYIPSSVQDVVNRVAATMSGQLHTKQQIIDIDNSWLSNPATRANLDKIISALGYTKSGTPVNPHPSTVVVHIGKGDGYPINFDDEIGHYGPHQSLMVNGLNLDPKKVWIAVPKAEAKNVVGISANRGLSAQWASKDITVGTDQWTVFLSPTALADDHISFDIKWSV